ncbi:hypothetical protein LIER_09357 [Lithospermum erythrorhizon]|uniref:Uncharacterized protein n=1 Tax=Lithospermum erythrorhizon TaxID=34254 RepID=A0AAV3PJQ0_LITER
MYDEELYKKSWDGPLLSCVSQEDIPKILAEPYSITHSKDKDKLSPKWKGPYRISRMLGPGTYELERMNGDAIPRTWHASKLVKYYV